MKVVKVGGRIKAAAIGLDGFYEAYPDNLIESEFRKKRQKPLSDMLKAFFPSDRIRMKKLLRGIGFYRPFLKTDQGMGGNFLPFLIDDNIKESNLDKRLIEMEEYLAFPEPWSKQATKVACKVQEEFYNGNFRNVFRILNGMETRVVDKGRTPFFFVRPAKTDTPIIFGEDVLLKVESAVINLLESIVSEAKDLELSQTGNFHDSNIIYCQPDIYISMTGKIMVEKINLPDVGMFMSELHNPYSTILPQVKRIISRLSNSVMDAFESKITNREKIFILTRSEVVNNQEDLLELGEIKEFKKQLMNRGYQVTVLGVDNISHIPDGSIVVLMNIDYTNPSTRDLISRHSRNEIECYPNPFVQMVAKHTTGLKKIVIPEKFQDDFLRLIGSQTKHLKGQKDVRDRINKILCQYEIKSDILHIDTGNEIIPVFRSLLHSWRQVSLRVKKYGHSNISIIELPMFASLLSSSTGDRLSVFRFMFVNK